MHSDDVTQIYDNLAPLAMGEPILLKEVREGS